MPSGTQQEGKNRLKQAHQMGTFMGGDFLSFGLGQKMFGGGRGKAKPAYDANIATGGKYVEQAYNNPTIQAGSNQTGALSGQGIAEQYAGQATQGMMDPSRSSMFAAAAAPSLQQQSASERFNRQGQSQVAGPGQGEQYWNQVQGRFNQPTNAQQAYNDMQNMPNFDAFYDRARERQAGGMNNQLAARGQYGSSAGLDMLSQGMSDLNAQQANREADFMLQQQQQRLGAAQGADTMNQNLLGMGMQGANTAQQQQLARLGMGGQLAGQADQSMLARLGMQGNLYNQGDAMDLQRRMGGMEMALGGQNAQRTRYQDMFNNTMAMSNAQAQQLGFWLPQMLQTDQALTDSGMAGAMGLGAEAVNQDRYRTQERMQMAQLGINAAGTAANAASMGM